MPREHTSTPEVGEVSRPSVVRKYKAHGSWKAMLDRCYNKNSDRYKWYGAIGITVCDEWRHDFNKFLEDMGERPDGMSIDRQNKALGYYKDNCRWANAIEQAREKRKYEGVSCIRCSKRQAVRIGLCPSCATWLYSSYTPEYKKQEFYSKYNFPPRPAKVQLKR